MAGCILFLVVGAAAVLHALLTSRRATRAADIVRLGGFTLTDLMRRGPPGRYRTPGGPVRDPDLEHP
jgi:hypothetical protein